MKNKNKILVLGASGMLGNYMYNFLKLEYKDIEKINRDKFDAYNDNILELKKYITPGSVVINCIGIIPQRFNKNKLFIKVNSIFPNELSLLCNFLSAKLIHITTDCVFSGKKGNYVENDFHCEENIYGISKSLGEPKNCLIIRTSIIGEEKFNKKSLLEWVIKNNNSEIKGYDNHYWNGVTCLQLSKIVKKIISENINWVGVRHIYSPNIVSKYDLVNIIINLYKLNIKLIRYSTKDKVDKTLSSIYDNNKYFKIPSLEKQIEDLYHFNFS